MYLDKDGILYNIMVGDMDYKMAIAFKEANLKLVDNVEGKIKVLVDLNEAGKPSSEERKIIKELSEIEKDGKVAHIGLHPVARMIASFCQGFSKKKDLRFFKTKDEALAWLKE